MTQATSRAKSDGDALGALLREGGGQHAYAALLGFRSFTLEHLMKSLEKGFAFSVLEHLARNTTLEIEELVEAIAIPARTVARRKTSGRFTMAESDRILRATRLFARALLLFEGDGQSASKWLRAPHRALGDQAPLALVSTELGQREVESLIDRLEHGVFS